MVLLLRAIRTLPEHEQDAILALLLQGLTDNAAWDKAVRRRDERGRFALAWLGRAELRAGGLMAHEREAGTVAGAKVVPIRFPAELHEQLRAWCEEQNLPMAAVVRGLVTRFLESEQLP